MKCPNCGRSFSTSTQYRRRADGTTRRYTYDRCQGCGATPTDPRPRRPPRPIPAPAARRAPESPSRAARRSLLDAQGGRCAICAVALTLATAHLDHDHRCPCGGATPDLACGRCYRAVLCARCNHVVGHAADNAEILYRAASYTAGGRFHDAAPLRRAADARAAPADTPRLFDHG